MRDAAEAGLFEVVWCLSPDRLARSYAYQVLILDELARLGVSVRFTDAPGLDQHDPQARLLTQVQGVIAEYERAKIGERYRRGKLFRARAGEVIAWKAPYGYRRIPRGPDGPAHLEIFEPEAAVVRRIFAERAAGTTIRQICRLLNAAAVPTPTGSRAVWGTSTLDRILRNEAYIGRTYFNRTEAVPDRKPGHHSRQVPRPRADWIAISCPAIIADETFQAAGKVSTDNTKWSPRRAEPGAWLLRGLVKCGPCGVGTSCHKMRGRNGTWHRYYYCHNHDPLRAGGQDRRCPERNIRADALDEFVFGQVRAALPDPGLLLAGEQAIAVHAPVPDDQLLAAELARLDRKLEAARGEHRLLIDLYQAGLIDMPELHRRAAAITARQRELDHKRTSLAAERADLARGNRLRHGVKSFAARVAAVIDQLDPAQRQELLRLLIEDVQVTGWHVKIRLRIPLDDPPDGDHTHRRTPQPGPTPTSSGTPPVSTEDRLRSLHAAEGASDQALALFSFPSLAAYEQYRAQFGTDPEFAAADRIRDESGCVLRYQRTFDAPIASRAAAKGGDHIATACTKLPLEVSRLLDPAASALAAERAHARPCPVRAGARSSAAGGASSPHPVTQRRGTRSGRATCRPGLDRCERPCCVGIPGRLRRSVADPSRRSRQTEPARSSRLRSVRGRPGSGHRSWPWGCAIAGT